MAPYDGRGSLPGYDAWKTTKPPEHPGGRVPACRCLDCSWTGKDAFAHHRKAHHRIVLRDAPQWGLLKFSCCQESER